LACGYGMGAAKFQETALADYGLALSDREALKAHTEWRRNNSRIVHFWYDMEDMVGRAVQLPGTEVWLADHTVPPYSQAGGHGVAARVKGRVLELRKPNGVKLSYHNMRYESGGLVFDGVNGITKKWGTERTYGGRLVENLVQSVARDVMAEGILTADRLPVMTVHDEIVWEVPEERSAWTADGLRNTVETVPVWAPGLPLASDVKILRRYGK
jgi:DNA polymerase